MSNNKKLHRCRTSCNTVIILQCRMLQEEMEETAAKLEKDDEEDFGTGKFAK